MFIKHIPKIVRRQVPAADWTSDIASMPGQSDGCDTTKKQRENAGRNGPEELDRKNGAERWAGRSFLAAGYREQYIAPAGLRPDH